MPRRSSPRPGSTCWCSSAIPYIGGAAVSRELYPGWTYSNCSYVCSLLRPEIYRNLDLARHGLQVVPYGGGVTFTRDGDFLGRYPDKDVRRREIARHSPRDADAYPRYARDTMRQTRLIRSLLMRTPPDPTSFKPRDIREMLHLGREFAKLGEQTLYDTIRFYSMSIADYLERVLRVRRGEGELHGQRHHRHGAGRVFAGHGVCAASSLHG